MAGELIAESLRAAIQQEISDPTCRSAAIESIRESDDGLLDDLKRS